MSKQSSTQLPSIFRNGLVQVGAPRGSVPASLAIASGECGSVFAGTTVGLFRSAGQLGSKDFRWVRLSSAPAGILAVAVSPTFEHDNILIVGTNRGIFCSVDGGSNWLPAKLPRNHLAITTIEFSPNFASDGIAVAGTLSDGILYSDSYGKSWISRNFGLDDGLVLDVAFSPEFSDDATLFASTDKSVYYSYNGTLAWKLLDFPDKAWPILSLAVSPLFKINQTIYAGTEETGLFRSVDAGVHWCSVGFQTLCINSLAATTDGVLAATDVGIFQLRDLDDNWKCVWAESTVLNLCYLSEITFASVFGSGIWVADNLMSWHPLPDLAARALVGVAIAPPNMHANEVFMFGPTEGLWSSKDGGLDWFDVGGELPDPGVNDLAISPCYADNRTLAAATPSGVLISTDACGHWFVSLSGCAELIVFSDNGALLAACLGVDGILVSTDLGNTWTNVSVPWDPKSKILSLAVSNAGDLYIACYIGVQGTLEIWQGKSGQFKLQFSEQFFKYHVVRLYIPVSPDRHWYASLGNRVLEFDPLTENLAITTTVFDRESESESIISMIGIDSVGGLVLLANTGRHLYKSVDAMVWSRVHDFGDDRCIALTRSSNYSADNPVFALMLGGILWKGVPTLT